MSDVVESAKKAVNDICERSDDSLDAWHKAQGRVTSRAAWKERALTAEAKIANLRAELAKVEGERAADQADRMVKISALIANLTRVQEHYGDTCVYIRRGGMAWGAVALNREADDKKHGVFDLQAQHARDMQRMAELVERWKADCKAAEARALAAEAKVEEMGKALGGLVYEDEGRFFAGVIGDTDVTDIVAPALQPKEQT